ncbi:uncharacterized protein METZ01_LOCUS368857, partial [marine metagenome]
MPHRNSGCPDFLLYIVLLGTIAT